MEYKVQVYLQDSRGDGAVSNMANAVTNGKPIIVTQHTQFPPNSGVSNADYPLRIVTVGGQSTITGYVYGNILTYDTFSGNGIDDVLQPSTPYTDINDGYYLAVAANGENVEPFYPIDVSEVNSQFVCQTTNLMANELGNLYKFTLIPKTLSHQDVSTDAVWIFFSNVVGMDAAATQILA